MHKSRYEGYLVRLLKAREVTLKSAPIFKILMKMFTFYSDSVEIYEIPKLEPQVLPDM